MKVIGQIHATAPLLPMESLLSPVDRRLNWT